MCDYKERGWNPRIIIDPNGPSIINFVSENDMIEKEMLEAERERIAKAGADFFQNGDFDTWESPTGRVFDDLGNGWQVGYDMMVHIIGKKLMKSNG